MDSGYALYVGSKLLGYSLWCALGLYLGGRKVFPAALGYGLARLAVGVGFGLTIFMLYHPDGSQNLWLPYFGIYAPIRWLEWSILAYWLKPGERLLWSQNMRLNFWRAGGIVVSFAIDALSPEGLHGMFCVGRCLC